MEGPEGCCCCCCCCCRVREADLDLDLDFDFAGEEREPKGEDIVFEPFFSTMPVTEENWGGGGTQGSERVRCGLSKNQISTQAYFRPAPPKKKTADESTGSGSRSSKWSSYTRGDLSRVPTFDGVFTRRDRFLILYRRQGNTEMETKFTVVEWELV